MIAEAVMDASSIEKITIRLLIAHQLAGSVIGKSGSKIKSIQEGSGAKIVISKDLLPQSTERVIEVVGSKESIHKALLDVGECLIADKDVVEGLIMYDPHHSLRKPGFSYTSSLNRSNLLIHKGIPKYVAKKKSSNEIEGSTTSKIAVPLDMVGCIIGPRGACINEIRESSGAKIHIASQESGRDERDVLITGSANAIATALQLLEVI
jgi:heterogeneous nuclear rnp K-like protein